jgi:hypothetical protein
LESFSAAAAALRNQGVVMKLRRLGVVTVVAGALCLGLVAAAEAQSGSITVQSVSSPPSDLGDLSVTLESTTPVVASSITATFYPQGSQTSVLSMNDFTLTGGQNSGATVTTWTVASPITLGQLPLGTYTVEVQAKDTGGDTADNKNAGTLPFIVNPKLTLAVSPSTYSYGQTVTLSGTETGLYPDGSTKPISGAAISISGGSPDHITASTDSSGAYTASAQAGAGGALLPDFEPGLSAFAAGTPTIPSTFSNTVKVTIDLDPTRITNFNYSPHTANFGAAVTVSGDISFESGGTWLPAASQPVAIDADGVDLTGCPPGTCNSEPASATTRSDGSFSAVISGAWGTNEYTLSMGNGSLGGWVESASTTFDVHVNHVPTRLDMFPAQKDIHSRVHLEACISQKATEVLPKIMALYPDAKAQYASRLSGPWKTVPGAGALRDAIVPPKHPGFCYRTTDRVPRGAVYYRMITPASTSYLAATSLAVKAHAPARTRIRHFAVSPRTINSGQRVRVSGQLFNLAYVKVQILFRPDGSRHWRTEKTALVSGDNGNWGPFSTSIVLHTSGDVAVRFPGQTYVFPYQTGSLHVHVR